MVAKSPRWGALTAVLLAVAVAGCASGAAGAPVSSGGTGTTAGSGGSLPGPVDDPSRIRIGVFPNITHAPGLVALADGGPLSTLLPAADIQVVPFNAGTTAVEAMFTGAVDMTYIGPNPAINAFVQSNGEAVRVVSGSTSGGAFLVVQPDIDSPADLRGRKLATPSLGNTQDVALRAWLGSNGLATDKAGGGDVSIIPQENAQTLETFQTGDIDGAWVPEPWATRLVTEGGAKILVDERDLWPGGRYVTTHLMVATRFLQERPDLVERVVLANLQAIDTIVADPAGAQTTVNAQIEAFTTKPLGPELLAAAWDNLTFTVDPVASSLEASAAHAVEHDLLEDPGDLAGLYDLAILNDLLRVLGRPQVEGLP